MAKRQNVNIRVTDEIKAMLLELAEKNNRSITNMIEVLVKHAYAEKRDK